MRALITGVAGFVGSNLAKELLRRGYEVTGIDIFTSYYNLQQKRRNLQAISGHPAFDFVEVDLRAAPLQEFVDQCDVVFHQAAQPGVRASWGSFQSYVEHNILVTQRLLEAARASKIEKFIYASSSSVYGNAATYPTREGDPLQPHSPYGLTKLAGEQLATLFGHNWGLNTVSLRYFTVYGPGQRPDMAMHRLINSALYEQPFSMFGDGSAVRDFTFVEDVVRANIAAVERDLAPGSVFNVAGGASCDMRSLVTLICDLSASKARIEWGKSKAGDVDRTGGDITKAKAELGWFPEVTLAEGLTRQIEWQKSLREGN